MMHLKKAREYVYLPFGDKLFPLYFEKDWIKIKIIEITKTIVFFKKLDTTGYGFDKKVTNEWEELHNFLNTYGDYEIIQDKSRMTF